MSTITRERVANLLQFNSEGSDCQSNAEQWEVHELARIALASIEADAVAWLLSGGGAKNNVSFDSGNAYADPLREVTPLYTAPPAPVSVPDIAGKLLDILDRHTIELGWGEKPITLAELVTSRDGDEELNACRAAMLQGAEQQNRQQNIPENIPATQFKPVADLYGLTSPTGSETSFTFDAVEARDFIDGGWSCQEYVELERFQEAVSGNSPVIPDGFCIMPKKLTAENGGKGALSGEFHVTNRIVCQSCGGEGCEDCNDEGGWDAEIPVSWDTIKRIHEAAVEACSLPAAPQQEVK
ncbi:hypothetical protein [Enterobacter kobei]